MDIRLHYVTALTLALCSACGANDLDIGTIDAAPIAPANTGGTSSPSSGGAGGSGGSAAEALTGAPAEVGSTIADGSIGIVDPDASVPTCDPFAATPKPITLGAVVAVGQSAAGTIYVVDQIESGQRVFVSDSDGTLARQRASGSSESDAFKQVYILSTDGPDAQFVLQIDKPTGAPLRMGVVQGTLKDQKSFTIGQDGEELTVLPDATIAARPIRNLPGEILAEYIVTSSLGEQMVVTRPRDDWSYSDFRVFLGPAGLLHEYRVTSAMRAHDGGSTTIGFTYLDSPSAVASFPVVTVMVDGGFQGFAPGPATLTIQLYGGERSLTRQSALPSAVYYCL